MKDKLIHFVKHWTKEIIIALALAILAAIGTEWWYSWSQQQAKGRWAAYVLQFSLTWNRCGAAFWKKPAK